MFLKIWFLEKKQNHYKGLGVRKKSLLAQQLLAVLYYPEFLNLLNKLASISLIPSDVKLNDIINDIRLTNLSTIKTITTTTKYFSTHF